MPARHRIPVRTIPATMVFVALVAFPAFAQFDRGQIAGIVKDQTGGVIPGATVTVTNVQTRLTRTMPTDTTGYYIFTALSPGSYDVDVELEGFKKWTQSNVKLDAAAKVVLDVTLQTGGLSESVVVEARTTPLQFDTQNRKTIESKDIENMAMNGRNPIMLAMLKAGVRSGTGMNTWLADSTTNGNFNINGSRSDENLIFIDGAIATRTRSNGAIVGTLNVDTVQEVQVLTSNYLPEYGRSSGGQIRFVTKSGGHDFKGSLYDFVRSDKLDANSWSRNAANNPLLTKPAPLSIHQFGGTLGGPLMIPGKFNTSRDRMFFFWAEEGIRYRTDSTQTGTVPSEKMRNGDFSELLDASNLFFGKAIAIRDPATGQPFPNNVIPANQLSANGLAFLRAFPLPTAGFVRGNQNWIGVSPNPRDTRKDTLRLDYVMNASNQISIRASHFAWKSVDAFRGQFPLARTDWSRPNTTAAFSWTSTIKHNLLNEFTFGYSLDEVFIGIFQGTGSFKRSTSGINYPYIFGANKEIFDKIPTISITNFNEVDGSPYPSSSRGPIYTWSDNVSFLKGRHSFKTGVFVEYSGEDDFDQINVSAQPGDTNNQNGRFEFTDSRTGGTGLAVANAAMGLFTNYGEIGQRSLTKWRALAMDAFVQDSWKPSAKLTVEGGVRYVLWPPWYALLNNAAMFDPAFYNPANAVKIDPAISGGGFIVSGDPYNGVVLPGTGFPSEAKGVIEAASNADLQRLFRGLPRGFSETHSNVFEPRVGVSYALNEKTIARVGAGVFHTRVTLNDSTLLGGNPPIQLKVGVSNGLADNPAGTTARTFPLVMTMQDKVFDHPAAYDFSAGIQRELPFSTVIDITYVGRLGRNLQRERNINQLQPGTIQANPTINPAALRPYLGFGAIRVSENAGKSTYNGLQISMDRRYRGGLKLGATYTLSRLRDDASGKRDLMFNAYDPSTFWAISDNNRTHLFNFHYIYELPFWRSGSTVREKIAGGWQIAGATVFQSGAPLSVWLNDDRAGVGDTTNQPWDLVGDTSVSNPGFSLGPAFDQVFWFNPAAFARPAAGKFGNAGRNRVRGPYTQNWDVALFKTFGAPTGTRVQFRVEAFNFPNTPNLNNPQTNPTNGSFGRITGKSSERNIQLSLKLLF